MCAEHLWKRTDAVPCCSLPLQANVSYKRYSSFCALEHSSFYRMQEDKKEPPAAIPAGGKAPPSFCDRLQKAFHARPAFRPLRRLTDHHRDGAAKPADDAGAGGPAPPEPARKHGGPPVPAPPRPFTSSPSPVGRAPTPAAPRAPRPPLVRLPAVTTPTSKKAAVSSVPTGPPVPTPPPDVVSAGVPETEEKAGEKQAQQTKGKNRLGFSVRKALSSK